VLKRLDANQSVVSAAETPSAEEREHFVRLADRLKRPCHLLLLDSGRDQTADEDRSALNELRRRLNAVVEERVGALQPEDQPSAGGLQERRVDRLF